MSARGMTDPLLALEFRLADDHQTGEIRFTHFAGAMRENG